MLLIYLILWIIFNERLTLEILWIGLIAAALVDLFAFVILGRIKPPRWRSAIRLVQHGVRYLGFLLREIFRCNGQVIRLILSPSLEIEPELHFFKTSLKTDTARVALANSITLTPGTITCALEDGTLTVHALDSSMAEGLERSGFEKRLLIMEDISNDA